MKIHLNLKMFSPSTPRYVKAILDERLGDSIIKRGSSTITDETPVMPGDNLEISVSSKTTGGTTYVLKDLIPSVSSVTFTKVTGNTNKFTFTMPDSDLTILATSKKQGYMLDILKDGGISATSSTHVEGKTAFSSVTFQRTMKSGYVYDGAAVVSGDAEIESDTATSTTVKLGSSDAIVAVKSRPNNRYMVTEDVVLCMNDKRLILKTNTVLEIGKNGKIIGVEPNGGGVSLTLADYQPAIDGLIASGVLVNR